MFLKEKVDGVIDFKNQNVFFFEKSTLRTLNCSWLKYWWNKLDILKDISKKNVWSYYYEYFTQFSQHHSTDWVSEIIHNIEQFLNLFFYLKIEGCNS